jgi:hypothetical protein
MHSALRFIRRECNSQQIYPHPARQWGFRLFGQDADVVQPARPRRLRLAFCTSNRGLAEPGRLSRPGISHFWLNRKCEANDCRQGVCKLSEGDSIELDSLPLHRCAALAHHKQEGFPSNSVGATLHQGEPQKRRPFRPVFLSREWARCNARNIWVYIWIKHTAS